MAMMCFKVGRSARVRMWGMGKGFLSMVLENNMFLESIFDKVFVGQFHFVCYPFLTYINTHPLLTPLFL